MVLVAMHAARQDLARYLREDTVHWRMAGMPAEVIVQSGRSVSILKYLNQDIARLCLCLQTYGI